MSSQTYLIGIAGPSGAGKTYLARHLAAAVGGKHLSLDHYYRDLSHLPVDQRARTNFDVPDTLDHELLIQQVARLREGSAVDLPMYDFTTHTRLSLTGRLAPSEVVILEGLFALYWPALRRLLDTKVYVETNDEMCLARRTERDVRERGRTTESVYEQYTTMVAPMALRYVRPCAAYADVVVFGADPIEAEVARVLAHCPPQNHFSHAAQTAGPR